MNEFINDKGDCRTALATAGLLKTKVSWQPFLHAIQNLPPKHGLFCWFHAKGLVVSKISEQLIFSKN